MTLSCPSPVWTSQFLSVNAKCLRWTSRVLSDLKCYVSIFFVFSPNFPVCGYVSWIISFSYQTFFEKSRILKSFFFSLCGQQATWFLITKIFERLVCIGCLNFLIFHSDFSPLQLNFCPHISLKPSLSRLTVISILPNPSVNSTSSFYLYDLVKCCLLLETIISLIFHAPHLPDIFSYSLDSIPCWLFFFWIFRPMCLIEI